MRGGSDAVSSVVGTVLILAITVATFGGISVVILQEVENEGSAPRVDLFVKSGSGQHVIQHRGGDALPAREVTVRVHDGSQLHSFPLTAFSVGDEWTIGESIRVSEVFAGTVERLDVLHDNDGTPRLLTSASELAGGGAA